MRGGRQVHDAARLQRFDVVEEQQVYRSGVLREDAEVDAGSTTVAPSGALSPGFSFDAFTAHPSPIVSGSTFQIVRQ
jgi:hypothetical protein